MNDKLNLDYGQLPPAFNPADFSLLPKNMPNLGNAPQDQDAVFMALRMLQAFNGAADFATTRFGFDNFPGRVKEANPLAAPFVKSPWTHIPMAAGVNIGLDKLSRELYKKDKFLGLLETGILNFIWNSLFMNNFKELDKMKHGPGYQGPPKQR